MQYVGLRGLLRCGIMRIRNLAKEKGLEMRLIFAIVMSLVVAVPAFAGTKHQVDVDARDRHDSHF